jgi:homoserine O-acetyltransferase
MGSNQHPRAKVHRFNQPFVFETPYLGNPEVIPALDVAYEEWGDPRHPAVLVCHALTGNTHCTDLEFPDDIKKAWWSSMVGPGCPIDSERFYVVCVNMLGGCGGSSGPATLNPDTGKPYGMHFPVVTVGDMVRSQRMLLDALGVKKLHAVIGGSMGGFQALVWSIKYPDFVERSIPVASSAYSNQFMIMTNRVQIDAIQLDRHYNNGDYYENTDPLAGLAVAREVGFTTFISPVMMERKFAKFHSSPREPYADAGFHRQRFHEAEEYLRRVSAPFSEDFDPNSMVYLLQTWNHFDLAIKYGSLAQAFENVRSKTLIVCATGDNLFPPYLAEDVRKGLEVNGKDVTLARIEDDYGHDFFLIPEIIEEKLAPSVRPFLEE